MKKSAIKRIIACFLCLAVFAGSELTGLTNIVGALSATEVSTGDEMEKTVQDVDTVRVEVVTDGNAASASGDTDGTGAPEGGTQSETDDRTTADDGSGEMETSDADGVKPGSGDETDPENGGGTKPGAADETGTDDPDGSGGEEPDADKDQSDPSSDGDQTTVDDPDSSGGEKPKTDGGEGAPSDMEEEMIPPEDGAANPGANGDGSISPEENQEIVADAETGAEQEPEEDEKNAEIYDKFQDGDLEDLMNVDKETVTAAMTLTESAPVDGRRRMRAREATSWNAAAYYVDEEDSYDVTKTDDFSLKYQIEFHTDTEIPAYGVTFRVPSFLLSERDETEHYADDIAVPRAEDYTDSDGNIRHKDVPAKTISFNYYEETREDGIEYYVFYNYEDLPRGTNAAFQVLYKKMEAMDLVDGTPWSFPVMAEVKPSKDAEEIEEKLLATLTGRVDTEAKVTSVTKAPYYSPATSNYTPALYTKKQVDQYAAQKTEAYQEIVEDHFSDYFYAVWAVRLSAEANQGFYVDLKENIPEGGGGKVVGVSYESPYMRLVMQDSPSEDPNQFRIYAIAEGYEWESDEDGSYYQKVRKADYGTLRIVMAYPRTDLDSIYEQVESQSDLTGWKLTNSITAIVTGVDGQDEPSELISEEGSFTYREYKWTYGQPTLSASKSNAEGGVYSVFNGWNNTYLQAKAAGSDRGSFVFNASAMMQDYGHTHDVKTTGAPVIEGKYNRLTVADDLLYLSENEGGMDYKNSLKNHLLEEDDYYFSSVQVNLKDYDFDIWEDATKPIDEDSDYEWRSTKIYAMYAKPGADGRPDDQGWYLVESLDAFSGSDTFTFDAAALAKEPYRVKVEHESNAHTLSASIKAAVTFRQNSPLLKEEFFTSLENGVTLENNIGIVRERVTVDENGDAQYTQISGNSDIDDLSTVRTDEKSLYPDSQTPERYRNYDPVRDQYPSKTNTQGFAYMNPSKPRSRSYKYGTITNDPVNERVNQRYNLVVYNGYDIYDETVINYMKSAEESTPGAVSGSPGHSEVVFYDLLPLGVKYDPSAKIIAGRITSLDDDVIRKYPDAWEQDDVTVTVSREAGDVIDDYRGTGRTLVRFHLKYEPGDPSVFATYKDQRMWMEGWGVSFGSYYSWKDEDIAKDAENIFAFSTAESDQNPLVGSATGPYKVCADNGELPADNGSPDTAYQPLVANGGLKGGSSNLKNIIFGKGGIEDDFAKSSQAEILKRVRAGDDPYGAFEKEAEVSLSGDYTYEMTVRVTQGEVKGLVVYDCLENAVSNLSQADRDKKDDGTLQFDENWWYGTFNGLVTNELTEKGIAPKIYYSADRDAVRPGAGESFADIKEKYQGVWIEASAWEDAKKSLADVKSVAVDLSKKTDGSDFVLSNMDAVSFQIKMTAPDAFQERTDLEPEETSKEIQDKPATWAYNNSSYSCDSQAETAQLNTSDAVSVRLCDSKKLTVEKQVKGEVPKAYEDASFTMKIEQTLVKKEEDGKDISQYTPYANKSYILYEKNAAGEWTPVDSVIRATDANGCLPLKDGQKAELNISNKAAYRVTEVESPFWKQTTEVVSGETITNPDDSTSLGTDEYTVTNEYRPVLYVQKSVIGCPSTVDKKTQRFRFQLVTVDDSGTETPVTDQEYWYVDSAYGDMPKKLGTGRTSKDDGTFIVKPGEILAMFPGEPGTKYIVRELPLPENGDWVVYEGKDEVEGTLGLSANRATITNLYRWRELAVTKELTHQDSAECTQPFTFRVEKVTEQEGGTTENVPASGNAWTLYNEDGTVSEDTAGNPVTGTLDENGRFTVNCAGKTVRIQKLEAGATYLVSEEVYEDGTSASEMVGNEVMKGSDYRPLTSTLIAEMPVYSQKRELTFTNDYLLRPITVSKTVAYDAKNMTPEQLSGLKNKLFTMTIYTREAETSEWTLYTEKEFTRSGASEDSSLANATDAQGRFEIRDGETITFRNVGRTGLQYKVVEEQEETYKQIYPGPGPDGSPSAAEASIGSEGGKAVFINGTEGLLMLGKEYTAVPEDSAANAYLAKIRADAELREKEAVTVTLETKDDEGKWAVYAPEEDAKVTVIDTLVTENAAESVSWSSLIDAESGALKLEPWKQVVLPMDGETEYRVRESEADQGKLYRTADCGLESHGSGYLAVEAMTAEVSGAVESQPVATLVNEISSIEPASTVAKAMRGGSTPVPTGERLVLQVQRYTGAEWKPVGGIRYIVTDFDPTVAADRQQELPVSAGVLETGPDGRIIVTKNDDSAYTDSERGTQRYPKIGFVSEVVRPEASASDWKAGDYRLVELLSESGSKWGGWYQSTWDPEKSAGTIWNSNRPIKVRIGKELGKDVIDDGSVFTFYLKQVTKLDEKANPDSLKAGDILESKDAGGMEYQIYDADDKYAGPGQTNAAGEIKLKAGQYAILEVTDATRWTVSERQNGEMKLTDLTAEKNAGKLAANLAVINARAERVPAYIRAESESKILLGTADHIQNTFTVTLVWSDGREETLDPMTENGSGTAGRYRMETTANEDGSVKCRFTSAEYSEEYPNLFDSLTLEISASGESMDFKYREEEDHIQIYNVPETGIYQIELWGASGGGNKGLNQGSQGGRGGYVKGWISLTKDTVLYVYVGGQGGRSRLYEGGWNGGGDSGKYPGGGGGGATDIRISNTDPLTAGENDPRIMVAGAGGGSDDIGGGSGLFGGSNDGSGGFGGGWEGGKGYINGSSKSDQCAKPGSQKDGNKEKIGSGQSTNTLDCGAGGGGWYGGFASTHYEGGGAGGSSFISGVEPCIVSSGCEFIGGETILGNQEMPVPNPAEGEPETEIGHWGDGYARIRLMTKTKQ